MRRIVFFLLTISIYTGYLFGQKKNILFIAVDDLKPDLGCYGDTIALSPNIDRLAKEGTVFANNHCQQAVCGPSRASLLTGWRPDRTQVWDLKTLIRDKNPNVITLPQYFKINGYETAGTGKIFDPRSVDSKMDELSWSIPFSIIHGNRWMISSEKVSTESADIDEEQYVDGMIASKGLELLEQLANKSKPFFLAVGFKKPHLPFVAPKKYWDLYNRDSIKIHPFQQHAANSPDYVYNNGGELRNNYVDISKNGAIPVDKQKELIHGYYACVSFIDAQVGKLLDKVDELGIKDSTVIILWGDHGWHLGDHAQWTKHTNFEQATRAPLIIVDKDYNSNQITYTPTDFIDIFPTLCDLTGIKIPGNLDGVSLRPILGDIDTTVKDFALSQYKKGGYEGYTIRTERYRYTEWIDLNYRKGTLPYSESIVHDRELYDYQTDPMETVSLIYDPEYQNVLDSMKTFLSNFLIHQFDSVSTSIEKKKNKIISDDYSLSNYPNPFNPTTTIEYSIPFVETLHATSLQYIQLKIYNILGEEISILVDRKQKPGTYKIQFNASGLNSGVYYYQLRAGNIIRTKPMLLIK